MRSALAIVLLLCLGATSAYAIDRMSIAKYVELEDNAVDKSIGSPVVDLYLSAVLDAYGIANATLEQDKLRPLYCQPEKLALGPINLRQLVGVHIKDSRANMSDSDWGIYSKFMNIADISLVTLKETFPCKK